MLKPYFATWAVPVGAILLGSGIVYGQNYPNKPLRIVTGAVGGGNDFISRIIAQGISGPLGQQVIVENFPTIIARETAVKAKPDGYTLLMESNVLWIGPLVQKTSYDPKDFLPITMIDRAPTILAVHPSLSAKSVKELIAIARSRPGELNYSWGGVATSSQLAGELFKSMTGTNIVGIGYKGGGPQINALVAGEVQMTFTTVTSAAAHLTSGRLRALAVTSAEPFVLLPGLPTVAASLPGFEVISIDGMFTLAGTPTAIISRLNQEIVRFLNQPEVKEKIQNTGAEMVGSSPEQLGAWIKADVARMGKVIKDAGIRVD